MKLKKIIGKKKIIFTVLIVLALSICQIDSFAPIHVDSFAPRQVDYYAPTPVGDSIILNKNETTNPVSTIKSIYYDEQSFNKSIRLIQLSEKKSLSKVAGGIVPHHLVAAPMIADFFSEMKSSNTDANPIETIFILGPNHKRAGEALVQTAIMDWDTPFGIMRVDNEAISEISDRISTHNNSLLLEQEHSVAALVPYAKYFFEDAKIVPILLPGSMDYQQCGKLAETINKLAQKESTLVIASVDFSHYLMPEKAMINDKHTLELIQDFDYAAIMRLNDDYLDAPQVLVTFLKIMDLQRTVTLTELDHKEASSFIGEYTKSTTSYFTLLFST